jgi:hypothetical protein
LTSTDWSVESLYKEQLAYREGERSFVFDAAWGVDPYLVYVPDAATWDDVVPDWLRGRREEVVGRIAATSGHTVVETDTGYGGDPAHRTAD